MPAMLRVRVAHREQLAEGIVSLALHPATGGELSPFEPGAHVDVKTPVGSRPYSLCNRPDETGLYRIAVLHQPDGRGGSAAMHALREGDALEIGAPRNRFVLVESAAFSILIAGGIGITPILPMAERLQALGRDFVMHYATKRRTATAFVPRIRQSPIATKVFFHHSDEAGGQRLDVTAALASYRLGYHVYVCGPAGLIEGVRAQAARAGWPAKCVHWEHFAAAGDPGDEGDHRSFDIVVRSTGLVVRVSSSQTVVEALAQHGITVPVSCAQGVCGTCLTRVIDGEVDHRDLYLTEEEQAAHDQFLPCCSRAKSGRLVLDL